MDYVRPQDNGFKSGVRWAEFTDGSGKGVRFSASEPMFMQALHFGWEDIFLSRHDGWQKDALQIRRYAPPVAQRETILNLDVRQTGLGGASVGPAPMEKYRFDTSAPVAWSIDISPVTLLAPVEGLSEGEPLCAEAHGAVSQQEEPAVLPAEVRRHLLR